MMMEVTIALKKVIIETQKQKKKGNKPAKEVVEKPEVASGKQKERKGKKKDEDDEDIEKMLAELELEYSGGKKAEDVKTEEKGGKKKNKKGRKADADEELEVQGAVEVEPSTPQEEVTEVAEESTESKKKKKKRRRIRMM